MELRHHDVENEVANSENLNIANSAESGPGASAAGNVSMSSGNGARKNNKKRKLNDIS